MNGVLTRVAIAGCLVLGIGLWMGALSKDAQAMGEGNGMVVSAPPFAGGTVPNATVFSSTVSAAGMVNTGQGTDGTYDPTTSCAAASRYILPGGSGVGDLALCVDGSTSDVSVTREGTLNTGAIASTGTHTFTGVTTEIVSDSQFILSTNAARCYNFNAANLTQSFSNCAGTPSNAEISTGTLYLNASGLTTINAGLTVFGGIATGTNCSVAGAAPNCGSAPAGAVSVVDGATTVTVTNTAVTANSDIQVTFDSSLGARLGVTCNTTIVQPTISAKTASTSFVITLSADPAGANPVCLTYNFVN